MLSWSLCSVNMQCNKLLSFITGIVSKLHVLFLLALLHSTEIALMLETVVEHFSTPVLLMAGNSSPAGHMLWQTVSSASQSHKCMAQARQCFHSGEWHLCIFAVFFISMDICCRIFKRLANDLTHYLQGST